MALQALECSLHNESSADALRTCLDSNCQRADKGPCDIRCLEAMNNPCASLIFSVGSEVSLRQFHIRRRLCTGFRSTIQIQRRLSELNTCASSDWAYTLNGNLCASSD